MIDGGAEGDERRIAVCVSGTGSNLRALQARAKQGTLGGRIVLVLADRPCPATDFAREEGIDTAVLTPSGVAPDGWDASVTEALSAARPHVVVLAGFMRILRPRTLAAFPGRILNVHPSLLPAYPGANAIRDALASGARVTGVTVHIVDEMLDGGPIVLQEAVPVAPGDDEDTLAQRIHAVEHRLLPHAVALMLAGAVRVDKRTVTIDAAAAATVPRRRRALISVSDKQGLEAFATALVGLGFEVVSTGGTARALRGAGLPVTDVAAVTGFPEMLDGRVKTLHPRVAGGVLADLRRVDHRAALAAAAIEPFELVVVNLYPFAEAATRPGLDLDALVEEIDIGGPTLVRAAAKNFASVMIVVDPARYPELLEELQRGSVTEATKRALAAEAFRHTAAYDALIADVLPARLGLVADPTPDGPADGVADAFPERVDLRLARIEALRYGENPHQRAAVYRVEGTPPGAGPFAGGVDLRQGKPLSYNNLLDAAAAAAIARDLHDAGCAIVKHTNPCGAAEGSDPLETWSRALAGDPVSAFGGVVALRAQLDAALARRVTSLFLEVVVAPPDIDADALPILATRPDLRVVVDPSLLAAPAPTTEWRSAGGALLATDADVALDDPGSWRDVTARPATDDERRDLDLAWRIARHVKSNAIVLVRDGALIGVGAGQMSRVDSARLAVAKAGPERVAGSVCASDAFFPFPDAVQVCLDAGVRAFVQPGGSKKDADVVAAADAAGAAMLLTGTRHFRH